MLTIITNVIAVLIIVGLVGGACFYIYKEKKKGTRCIGCPNAGNCQRAKMGKACSSVDLEKIKANSEKKQN